MPVRPAPCALARAPDNKTAAINIASSFPLHNGVIDNALSMEAVAVCAFIARHGPTTVETIRQHFGLQLWHVENALREIETAEMFSPHRIGDLVVDDTPPPTQRSSPPRRTCAGYVYLIRSPDYYKIGCTRQIPTRMAALGTMMPFSVKLLASTSTDDMYGLEAALHARFADQRINGEWFRLSDDDVDYVVALAGEAKK